MGAAVRGGRRGGNNSSNRGGSHKLGKRKHKQPGSSSDAEPPKRGMSCERFPLKSGGSIPQLGLGISKLNKPGEIGAAVRNALDNGYRHIDCALAYENMAEVGDVFYDFFSSGKVAREDVFVTFKLFWNVFHRQEYAAAAIDTILSDLRLEYLDLLLIRWPHWNHGDKEYDMFMFPKEVTGVTMTKQRLGDVDYSGYMECWSAMEEAKRDGKVRSLGVSNFERYHLERLQKEGSQPVENIQMGMNPYCQREGVPDYATEHGMVATAHSLLAKDRDPEAKLLTDPVITTIAARHNKSPAQVAIRWAIQRGTVVIQKSTSEHQMKENTDVFDFKVHSPFFLHHDERMFELGRAEMRQISGLSEGYRF